MYSLGQGAIIPLIPSAVLAAGGSLAFAALVMAMLTVGQLVGALPAGHLVSRYGERKTLAAASTVAAFGGVLGLMGTNKWLLLAATFLIGVAAAAFLMARHAYVTTAIPRALRGRTLSTVAGFGRLGLLVGPFLTAALLTLDDSARTGFAVTVASSVAVIAIMWASPASSARRPDVRSAVGVLATMSRRRKVLVRVGSAAALLGLARSSRQVLVPVWGVTLHMADSDIALVMGLSALVDVSMFYTGGYVMDRFGRLWVAIPTCSVFAAALLMLAALESFPNPTSWLVTVALLTGIVNGLSSGVNATMGSDLADRRDPAAFLSSWRLVSDSGPAAAPLLISLLTATFSLAVACAAMGALAGVGALLFARYVPRYLKGAAAEP
jgi:MFS family permease